MHVYVLMYTMNATVYANGRIAHAWTSISAKDRQRTRVIIYRSGNAATKKIDIMRLHVSSLKCYWNLITVTSRELSIMIGTFRRTIDI